MNRRMDWLMVNHVIRLIALVLAIALNVILINDAFQGEPVNRSKVIGLAFGSVFLVALATWMILNPPE